jgi:hypothetical protein
MEQGLNTDHFPIISNFNLDVKLTPKKVISNFRDVDWQEFCKMLEKKINAWGVPNFIKSQKVLERECKRLTIALQETISEAVPSVVLGPQANAGGRKNSTHSGRTCSNVTERRAETVMQEAHHYGSSSEKPDTNSDKSWRK